jgi:hypothetical protein
MAKRMAELYQGADNKTVLSVSRGKVEEKKQNHPERCSYADRT